MAERTDPLHIKGYSIIQDKNTFCYGIDAVLLADFVFNDSLRKGTLNGALSVFDLGTGNGIIPVLLGAKAVESSMQLKITGLELQPVMANMASRSLKLNELDSFTSVITGDIREVPQKMEQGCADAVISNPPYMLPQNGRQSSNLAKMTARQELFCSLKDVVNAAAWLLKKPSAKICGGSFYMIHRPERLEEIITCLKSVGLNDITMRLVKPFAEKKETMVLIRSAFDENIQVQELPPLVVYSEPGQYTEEVKKIYGNS